MIINIILIVIAGICLSFSLLIIFNEKYLPKWFCNNFGWHLFPQSTWMDGMNEHGKCPRCGKECMKDSQGNWFEVD